MSGAGRAGSGGDRAGSRGRAVAAAVVVLVLVLGVLTIVLFVRPASDDAAAIAAAGPVDAVLVLGGSPGDRYDAAVELVPALPPPAPALVLAVQYAAPVLTCGTAPELPDVALTCFSPEPATTSGEAVWLGREAASEGWEHVVVTTSDYHLTRSRLLVERCVAALSPGTEVRYLSAPGDDRPLRRAWRVATEWPSLLGTPWDHHPDCRAPD